MARRNYKINAKVKARKSKPSARAVTFQGVLIREARKFALLVLCCAIPAYVYVLSLPQEGKLEQLHQKLADAKVAQKVSEQANDRITREIKAFESNPDYLEIIARDHLNLCKKGETIVRIIR